MNSTQLINYGIPLIILLLVVGIYSLIYLKPDYAVSKNAYDVMSTVPYLAKTLPHHTPDYSGSVRATDKDGGRRRRRLKK